MMDDVLVIGAGPAGLLAAWIARQRGAKVRVLAAGIGTTHVSPGWLRILETAERGAQIAGRSLQEALASFSATHPAHPYALAGLEALHGGIAALHAVTQAAGLSYVGDLSANYRLPTALGAVIEAACVPESFAAGDLRQPGALLIAGPAGWRDFYPRLCADNLARQGYQARGIYFDLPEMAALSQFDATPLGLAALLAQADIRARVAAQLKPQLDGATRVGLPAVLGLAHADTIWRDLQERLGVPVFEIPTLPPSVPGIRLYNAFKAALTKAGVPILLDMTATRGVITDRRATGVIVPDVVRERIYRAETYILATGGLYGGGITSDFRGTLRETVFGLPLYVPGDMMGWFNERFLPPVETLHATSLQPSLPTSLPPSLPTPLRGHPIHLAGVQVNAQMQPVDEAGRVVLENVRIAGRLLASYDPIVEGSTEGVWLATAYQAAIL